MPDVERALQSSYGEAALQDGELGALAERLFELFCGQDEIPYQRLPEGRGKTADYLVQLGEQEVVVEVKGIGEPEACRKALEIQERTGKPQVFRKKPGTTVRNRIKDSYAQIKASAEGRRAGLLVLYGHGHAYSSVDPHTNIRVALSGIDTVEVHVATDPHQSPQFGKKYQGSGKGVTPSMNRALSGVARLNVQYENPIRLEIVRNPHALMRLEDKVVLFSNILLGDIGKGSDGWDYVFWK